MKLTETFAVLKPDMTIDTVAVSPTIYAQLDAAYNQFKSHALIAMHAFDKDWGVWERHPAGDEVVVLLSGAADMRLRRAGGDDVVALREPGSYVVVPRGVWHTAEITERAQMLFITPGEGTENRETLTPHAVA
ncbi:cupin domain-containing protein [Sinimarinibacterium sp. CAU 1509]|uniref:cupin domain-containing protein n=1 Tax=Sinimarinibacterium sp. CAU 1509 TaxID=2562283 RepID=UPI0010ABDA2B|nr:cupin domain-containing protein [Sinimarinibacterium sp. CAU 1509]TJY55184.1 cupin domain-containing protein [Sinimarinibacterium sp. CAU 1509]